MYKQHKTIRACALAGFLAGLLSLATTPAMAQLSIPAADGSDGSLAPTENITIDLGAAVTGNWDQPATGSGIYDPEKWAVVYKYGSVNIPAGVNVYFTLHPSRAPVVWLVSGNVNIAGTVHLEGENYKSGRMAEPGPGGFRSGIGYQNTAARAQSGLGPGGATSTYHSDGAHATVGDRNSSPTYGNPRVLPLTGGSGGGGDNDQNYSGGAGGGALLLAASGSVTLDGLVKATGGTRTSESGEGSGGAVRIIAESVSGVGAINAEGPSAAGEGRVRIETNNVAGTLSLFPSTDIVAPDNPVLLWPPDGAPIVRVLSIEGVDVPADPRSEVELGTADVDVPNTDEDALIVLETENVPSSWIIRVRLTPKYGIATFATAVHESGTDSLSTWNVTAPIPDGFFIVQAHARKP